MSFSIPINNPKTVRFFIIIIGSLFTFMGLMVMLLSILTIRTADEPPTWPTTQGEIIISKIERYQSDRYGHVKYVYSVDSKEYNSSNIDSIDFRAGKGTQNVPKYPVGKKVTVFYNPKKPHIAVLEPHKIKDGGWATLGIGAIFFVIGLVFIQFWRGKIRLS